VPLDKSEDGVKGRVPHSFAYFANEWARRAALLTKFLYWTRFYLDRPLLKVNADRSMLAVVIGAETAPPPLLRLLHQPALHWITVHVAQFLDSLAFAPHIEVVEALLPNRLGSRIP
jgi:hypothetical protein